MSDSYTRMRISILQNAYATSKKKKEESFSAKQAKLRPANYDSLTIQEQWDIDKALGILDWGG